MYEKTLESLGLSPNEAKIYESLIDLGKAPVSKIAVKSNTHRRNVYDALARLLEKGLVFQIFQKGEHIYEAVNPDKLSELLQEKRKQLDLIMPGLKNLYQKQFTEETAFIYKGVEGFKNYMRDMARVGKTVYFIGAKALWFTPNVPEHFLTNFQKSMAKNKVKYYTIFDPRVKKQMPDALAKVGGEYRIFPEKYASPGVCDIFGDYVVTFNSVDVGNFGDSGTIFVMKNKKLAENFRLWFQFMWDHLPEEK
ncbi:MAG: helix-turn-helix domain-containing protein [Patescibacteria group bacterium]|nr:helix-turn-helix domain-containing protein [Patescibacteria group bacterium]MDD4611371.1 helix-turn-helix domain-containing protein [Patescibacteria group bacterium]